MAQWLQFGLQNASSDSQEELILIHDYIMVLLTLIIVVVGYTIIMYFFSGLTSRALVSDQTSELLWTLFPIIFLVAIALPSLRVLYVLDEVGYPDLTIKVVGHQWYWSYEYDSYNWLNFDSYMVSTDSLPTGGHRLLEVDNRVVLPGNCIIRALVTAADVLHSWTVPSMGVKADAVPGRLNQLSFFTTLPGVFYGQCSEICGANHSFMPIVVETVSMDDFINWGFSV